MPDQPAIGGRGAARGGQLALMHYDTFAELPDVGRRCRLEKAIMPSNPFEERAAHNHRHCVLVASAVARAVQGRQADRGSHAVQRGLVRRSAQCVAFRPGRRALSRLGRKGCRVLVS